MMTRVFLLRHAESANPRVFHGAESDTELSPLGEQQAVAIAEYLRSAELQAIVASGMRRAQRTAQAIAHACGLTVETEPELHERRVGFMSGQGFDGGNGIWPETIRRWDAGETSFAHEGAESLDDLRRRVLPVWSSIVERHEGKRIAMVAHGVVIKTLLLTLLEGRTWQSIGSIRNVAITELTKTGNRWNDVRIDDLPPNVAGLQAPTIPH
ncbi:MAG: histidine phosphatase family protein [Gemmataceae bacterium]|nr:histidine phosphatase family protein [Gemmataceae bacterium]